ncbi:MAG: peptide deformylase [Patescibacteria group bacterium]
MVIKTLRQIGDPVLSVPARVVTEIGETKIKKIVRDLKESLHFHQLIGLAAPQIGVGIKIFVTEIYETETRKREDSDKLRVYINPRIVWQSKKEAEIWEGCGSVAHSDIFAPVIRPASLRVRAQNEKGQEFELKAKGLLARVILHEYDHLLGIHFLEKVTEPKRIMDKSHYLKQIVGIK